MFELKSSCFGLRRRVGVYLVWMLMFLGLGPAGMASRAADELRTAAAVRALTMSESREAIPVRLHGVVTFFDDNLYSHFIQDQTAGIYLRFPLNVATPTLVPGQVVDVVGVSSPGEYAPVVLVKQVKVTGKAPLPPAKPVTYEQLASGTEDSQFVEINGVVRSVKQAENSGYYRIEVATGGGRLQIYARRLPVKTADELPDSTVRVRGVCSTQFNHQRQLFAIRLMVPRPADLQVEIPAAKDPFDVAVRPIGSLLQFTPQQTYGHRVKVHGTVIYFEPGDTLFIQDGHQGVEVQTQERDPLELGDQVEVLGFVHQGDYTPILEDAIYRQTGPPGRITPHQMTSDEVLKGDCDSQLIRITGRLVDRSQHGAEQYLILQENNFIFQASLKRKDRGDNFSNLENGSYVAVTGVCRIEPGKWEAGKDWRAKSFSVLLRSPDDVVLLKAPPWWTLKRVIWISGALAFVTLAAFGWVAVLRRRVAQRTRELEVQIQQRQLAERRREIEQERARVAHDLHDDLGAGLTEVNMLSSLVKSPMTSGAEKDRYLDSLNDLASRMVTSLDEIVWAINPRNDTIASLASYFGAYAQRLLDLASVACGLDMAEDLPDHPLDPKFRQELFFAFKEALTNVVRHAGATQVWLRVFVKERRLVVEVVDDGAGFDPGKRQPGDDGLANMKERLKSLGGSCEIMSGPHKGTTVRFCAPLPPGTS